jgi:hypothetical protein
MKKTENSATKTVVARKYSWWIMVMMILPLIGMSIGLPVSANSGIKGVRANILAQDGCGQCARIVTRRALQINGGLIEGNVQQLTADFVNLNDSSALIGNFLVPGTPFIIDNSPNLDPANVVVNGCGDAAPSNYGISLNGNINLAGQIIRQVNPIELAALEAIPTPVSNRNVSINTEAEAEAFNADANSSVDLRNLNLNNNVGAVKVAPGIYGTFNTSAGTQLVLGVAGSSLENPAVYNFQDLNINTGSQLVIVGFVKLRVQNQLGVGSNAQVGVKLADDGGSSGGGGFIDDANLTVDTTHTTSDTSRLQIDLAGNLSLKS